MEAVKGKIQEALSLAIRSSGTKPCHPVSPFGSQRASSSHSSIHELGSASAATTAAGPARSSSIRGYSHFSWGPSTIASSTPVQSSIRKAKATVTSLLASSSPICGWKHHAAITSPFGLTELGIHYIVRASVVCNDSNRFRDKCISEVSPHNGSLVPEGKHIIPRLYTGF